MVRLDASVGSIGYFIVAVPVASPPLKAVAFPKRKKIISRGTKKDSPTFWWGFMIS